MHPNHQIKKYFTALLKYTEDLQDLPKNHQGAEFLMYWPFQQFNIPWLFFRWQYVFENMNASKNL